MAAPVNTVAPAITGTAEVGQSLSLSNGTWTDDGSPTFTYAWLRAGVVITGQATNAYVVALVDIGATLIGRVTNTDTGGAASATSSATGSVPSTLIPEDGTVVANADSYGSLAYADTYHAARGNTTWAALSAADKEANARKATDYMIEMYRSAWKGYRKDAAQVLDWPRTFVYLEPFVHGIVGTYPFLVADTIVPVEVKNAWAELALRASLASLAPDLERGVQSETIGPISTTYDKSDVQYTRYRAIDALLAPYLNGSPNNIQLVRV